MLYQKRWKGRKVNVFCGCDAGHYFTQPATLNLYTIPLHSRVDAGEFLFPKRPPCVLQVSSDNHLAAKSNSLSFI